MIDEKAVKHVAKLARIDIDDKTVKKFAVQLGAVFEYMEILNEVDTSDVPATSQVTGLQNVMDEDVVRPSQSSREELLRCTELPVDSKQIRVKKTI